MKLRLCLAILVILMSLGEPLTSTVPPALNHPPVQDNGNHSHLDWDNINESLLFFVSRGLMNVTAGSGICNYSAGETNLALFRPYWVIGNGSSGLVETYDNLNDGNAGDAGWDYARLANGSSVIIDLGDEVSLYRVDVYYNYFSTTIDRVFISRNGVEFFRIDDIGTREFDDLGKPRQKRTVVAVSYDFEPGVRGRYLLVHPVPLKSRSLISEITVRGYQEQCVNVTLSDDQPCSRDFDGSNYKKLFGSCTLSNQLGAHCVSPDVM